MVALVVLVVVVVIVVVVVFVEAMDQRHVTKKVKRVKRVLGRGLRLKCALGRFSEEVQAQLDRELLRYTRHEVFRQLQFMSGGKKKKKDWTYQKQKLKGRCVKAKIKKLDIAKKKDVIAFSKRIAADLPAPLRSRKSMEVLTAGDEGKGKGTMLPSASATATATSTIHEKVYVLPRRGFIAQ